MPDTWMRTVEQVFHEACDRPTAERERFLRQRCASDSRLRREVQQLLDADKPAGAALTEPGAMAPVVGELASAAPGLALPPERIGPYRILQPLGEGGFAEVYLAEQEHPVRRRVALKLIKPGMDSRAVLARFEAERQALAMMDHPGVARVLDAGVTESGRPYFAMHYVPGEPVTAHCDRQRLGVEARLDLFVRVCDAIQHAHQKGIIHRDIKPSNVLVTVRAGRAEPVVIDFGVAKAMAGPLAEQTVFTAHGQLIGTPEYMSPEQAELTAQDVDTRSDIYSLGVLLYELLTGALPFDRETLKSSPFAEIQRIIREVEPPRPSTRLRTMAAGPDSPAAESARNRRTDPEALQRRLRGDLDWITMRALDKDRTRRYGSASELAADCLRHLAHEPVSAGPPGAGYRVRKFVRRNRLAVAAAGVLLGALVTGTVGTSIGLLRAAAMTRLASDEARSARRAEAEAGRHAERAGLAEREARWNSYVAGIGAACAALVADEVGSAQLRLDAAPEEHRNWEWYYARARMDTSIRTLRPDAGPLCDVAAAPDGSWIAAAGFSGPLVRWGVPAFTEEARVRLDGTPMRIAVSPDGALLAATIGSGVALVDTRGWSVRRVLPAGEGQASDVAFTPEDPSLLAVAGARGVELWDHAAGERRLLLPTADAASAVAFGPGGVVLGGTHETTVHAWDIRTGAPLQADGVGTTGVYAITVLPGPEPLIAAGRGSDGGIDLWALGEPRMVARLLGHTSTIHRLAIAPGRRLLSASGDRTLGVWDARGRARTVVHRGHSGRLYGLTVMPDGGAAVSAALDGTVKLWDLADADRHASEIDSGAAIHGLAFSPDGARLVALGADGDVRVYTVLTGRELARWRAHPATGSRVAIDPAGTLIITATGDGGVRAWDPDTGDAVRTLRHDDPGTARWHEVRVSGVSIDAAGRIVAAPTRDGAIDLWDAQTGELRTTVPLNSDRVYSVAFGPAGGLAAGDSRGRIAMIDTPSGRHAATIDGAHARPVFALAFAPDGARLASGAEDGSLALWDARTRERRWVRTSHTEAIFDASFSPNGTRLATASNDRTVRLWDSATGVEIATLTDHRAPVACVAFSPDGSRLASGAVDGRILVRDTTPAERRWAERRDRAAAERNAEAILGPPESAGDAPGPAAVRADRSLSPSLRAACLDALLERRHRAGRAGRAIVRERAASLITRDAVIRSIRDDPALDPGVRRAALPEAERLADTPERLLDAAWSIVVATGATGVERAAAVSAAGSARAARPDDPRALRVLGGARLRAADAEGAIELLARAMDIEQATHGAPTVHTLALLACAHAQAGNHERAAQAAARLRDRLNDERWSGSPDALVDEGLRAGGQR